MTDLALADLGDAPPAKGDGSAGRIRIAPNDDAELDRGLDDIGNAARFVDEHSDELRFVPAWNAWLVWDGTRWAKDERLEHLRRAKETARRIGAEAVDEPDEERRKAILRHALASAREPRLRAMAAIAASDPRLVVVPSELDADPWLLNAANGTVDLRDGTLRPHGQGDLLTKVAGAAAFEPEGGCPTWDAHLSRVFNGDEQTISFVQRLIGCAAIGDVREHVLPILSGTGANGKTTTLNALSRALGDYAHAASVDLIVSHRREAGQATPELAELKGRRLVTVAETRQDGKLAVERVKAITGGDPISARYLHSNPFTFNPTHTVFLCTNHKPRVGDHGHAIWRRLLLIPFMVTITASEKDPNIDDRLADEADGILTWIVAGALEYQRLGLDPPPSVLRATADYRRTEDAFADFLAERVERDVEARTRAGDVHTAYKAWADANGAPRLTRQSLAEAMEAAGFTREDGKYVFWMGLRMVGNDV